MLTALAFAATSIVGLALVPIIVGNYGLTAMGLLVLARLFLPTGFLSIIDFGFPELATEAVARARVSGDWMYARSSLTCMLAISVLVAIIISTSLLLLKQTLVVTVFNVSEVHQVGFSLLIVGGAIALLVSHPASIAEGVVKGFERYDAVRALEVASNLAYAVATLLMVWLKLPFHYIGYAYLAAMLAKSTGGILVAFLLLKSVRMRLEWPAAMPEGLLFRAGVMSENKVLGAIQGQSLPIVIGILVGANGVAIYDLLSRIPRFLKIVMGTLTAALLPVAARLQESEDADRTTRMLQSGIVLGPAAMIPVAAAGMLFSEQILSIWIGADFNGLAIWLSALFLIPLLNAPIQFGQTMLLVRPHATQTGNRMVLLQVSMTYLIGLLWVGVLEERAFILGQVTATCITFFPQIRLISREYTIRNKDVLLLYLKLLLLGFPLGYVVTQVTTVIGIHTPKTLILGIGVFCISYWWILYFFGLRPAERLIIWTMLPKKFGAFAAGAKRP